MLSKSQYIRGLQCEKSLWLYKHKRELENISISDNAKFNTGYSVGDAAKELFAGGIEIEFDNKNFTKMIDETKELIKSGQKVIYEATFSNLGIFAMADILVQNGDKYDIYEVKSSTSIKDYYLDDASVQWYCINKQIPLNRIYIVHINTSYERHSKLDLNALFKIVDVTNEIKSKQKFVGENVAKFENMVAGDEPQTAINTHCYNPFECSFKEYCFSNIPQNSVFDLYRMNISEKFSLYHKGIISFDDIRNSNIKLNKVQNLQVNTMKEVVDKVGVNQFLDSVKYPIYFLDFETFSEPIPRFDSQKPYQQIPFQFSLHILQSDGSLIHKEFLGDGYSDPRRNLADTLVRYIGKKGTIMAYNASFEKNIIKGLAYIFNDISCELLELNERFVDLLDVFKNLSYYNPKFNGSFSIKSVLPALFPNDKTLNYKILEINNGGMASEEYAKITNIQDLDTVKRIRKNLQKYCHLDTLAMVKIFEKLKDID